MVAHFRRADAGLAVLPDEDGLAVVAGVTMLDADHPAAPSVAAFPEDLWVTSRSRFGFEEGSRVTVSHLLFNSAIRTGMSCCLAALAGLAENEAAQRATQQATDGDGVATADRAQGFLEGFLAALQFSGLQ
jgi:hypothetical protein